MSKIDKDGNISISSSNPHIKPGVNSDFREVKYNKSFSGHSIFALIFLVLFIYAYFSYVRTGKLDTISFSGLLEYLSTVPDISTTFNLVNISIGGDWGMFDFLRDFFNFFCNCFNVLCSVSGFIWQGLIFIIWCIRFLFL